MSEPAPDWRADLMAEVEKESGIPVPRDTDGTPIFTPKYLRALTEWERVRKSKEPTE